MFNYILSKLCPSIRLLTIQTKLSNDLIEHTKDLEAKIQKLEDVISHNKTVFTDEVSKLAVTSHAIHRYRERHKGKGTDEEISKMLFKLLVKQLYATDKLQDGKHVLKKNLIGIVKNNTLVTVAPQRDIGAPRLK